MEIDQQDRSGDWSLLRDATEDLLFYSMEPQFAAAVEAADRAYLGETAQGRGDDAQAGWFEEYLLFEFRWQGRRLAEHYSEDHRTFSPLFKSVKRHYFSGFELMGQEGHYFLKDLFTKEDFKLLNGEDLGLQGSCFLTGRLFAFKEGWALSPDFEIYPRETMEAFRRAILERYNAEGREMSLGQYLENHALLMMRYLDIVETILSEEAEEEAAYVVHQATYLHQHPEKVSAILSVAKDCESALEDPEDQIFRVLGHGEILAEILVMKQKAILECVDEQTLMKVKAWFENLMGELVVHFSDEVLSLDDLLES